jgi:biopolymer transport protein ExbD/biopolymer transport protein TolR
MNAAGPRRALYEPLAEINVTPLVDVMLVLLIVFMITAPMLAAGMKVELPRARAAEPTETKRPIVLTVRTDGALFLGQDEIGPDAVVDAVRRAADGDRDRAIHLRGNRDVSYGAMVSVMDRLAGGGFGKIALIANTQAGAPVRR